MAPTVRNDELLQMLVREWSGGDVEDAPRILELKLGGQVVEVQVSWDAWTHLDELQRSELITEAFMAVKGEDAIQWLVSARGVTKEEAERERLDPFLVG